jgi:hypothetical protein
VLIRNNRHEDTLNKFKLHPRYLGPYEVVRKTTMGSYILKELDGALHQQHYAAFRLISYINWNDPILWESLSNEEGDELDNADQDRDTEMEEWQERSDTSEGEFDIPNLDAGSGQGSDRSNSCLALIMDMATDEASSTESNQTDLPEPFFFFFFFNQKFITRGSLAVRGQHIQTICKLRLCYALTVMYYQNLDAVSGRQTWASPRVSMNDVALSSGVCSRALTTGPTPNCDAPPGCPHRVPQPEPNTRSGQSLDGVNSP